MTDNTQPESANGSPDMDRVQEYRRLMLEYEALDEEIDTLLARYNGATEKMSDEAYDHYRDLARRRDYVYYQMKALERQLFPDDDAL